MRFIRVFLSCAMLWLVLGASQGQADLVVATWSDFTSPVTTEEFAADSGLQAGTALLDVVNANDVTITSGEMIVDATGQVWPTVILQLTLDGTGLQNFVLDYDVLRDDGNGKGNHGPELITWSANGTPVTPLVLTNGVATHQQVDFSSISGINNNSVVTLVATFDNSTNGGVVNTLTFDNVSVSAVPEASSFLCLGLVGTVMFAAKRSRKQIGDDPASVTI